MTGGQYARINKGSLWQFANEKDGSFQVTDADYVTGLYFPLMNHGGMKCSVTPQLKGDICSDFDAYHSIPVVTEDLHRIDSSRNFWVSVPGREPWSITGVSAAEKARKWKRKKGSTVHAGLGYFSVTRRCPWMPLEATITVFVPSSNELIEICIVTIRNTGKKTLRVTPTYATPIFARSADNIRDHRQVTSMFNAIAQRDDGVVVIPRIVHDESGHRPNTTRYFVLGYTENGGKPRQVWSSMIDFTGEGGSLDNPEAIYERRSAPKYHGNPPQGVEAVGAVQFSSGELKPGNEKTFICCNGITDSNRRITQWSTKFGTKKKAEASLVLTKQYWQDATDPVALHSPESDVNQLLRWISFQAFCRKIYGNSYLPDYGYGRGGRGWRDLWSDLLTLFLMDPQRTKDDIVNNFLGVRIDGSNATIIGTKPGEFVADRNDIVRTWCDHGTWPFFVLNFYIQQTGDYRILLSEIPYWKDKFSHRSTRLDSQWDEASYGTKLKDAQGNVYKGSILEHVLLMQLSVVFNVGEHNNILLEGGDWNDTYDMARTRGESVAFYSFYAWNCRELAALVRHLHNHGVDSVSLAAEMLPLLDKLSGQNTIAYESVTQKREALFAFFDRVVHTVSGERVDVPTQELAGDLEQKAEYMYRHIREKEWVKTKHGRRFFNGHYDDHARRVDGDHKDGVCMDLTSQVIPVMGGVADRERIPEIQKSLDKYLYNRQTGGIRLCTEFKKLKLDLGRVSGFVYGVKEHGSIWNQMNAMYMYGLYKQGFVDYAYRLFREIVSLCMDSSTAKTFPNLPSYFTTQGRGGYCYLTGSATWFITAVVTQMCGIRGYLGDLCLHPKLKKEQFGKDGEFAVDSWFADRKIRVVYHNPDRKEYGEYGIGRIRLNKKDIGYTASRNNNYAIIERNSLQKNGKKSAQNRIDVELR